MRKYSFAFVALFVPSVVLAWGNRTPAEFRIATAEELALKNVPMAPGASAVILDWIQKRDDVDGWESEYFRIKIFSDEGKKHANIEIPYVPLLANVDGLAARTTKPDGTIVPFTGRPFDKLLVRAGGIRVNAKTLSLPEVQAGCIIEYWYRLGFRGGLLHNTHFEVQGDIPVLHEELSLRPYLRQFRSFFAYRGLPPGKKPVKNGDRFELILDNVPAFEKEPLSPPDGELKPTVDFMYTMGEITQDTFWEDEGKRWADVIEGEIGDRSGIRKAVAEMVAGAGTPEGKLRSIYTRVQQIRNRAFEHEQSEQETSKYRDNHNVEDVLRNGYGWPSEINRLFIALARASGFQAQAFRTSERNRSFFSKSLLVGEQLSSEMAVVSLDGKRHFFDPATPYAPFGVTAWQKAGVWGLLLEKKRGGTWMQSPEQPASAATITRTAVVRLENDVLRAAITVTYGGQQALVHRLAAHDEDESAVRKRLEDEIKGWLGEGATVKVAKVDGLKTPESVLVVAAEVELPSLGSFVGPRALIPMSIFSASAKNPFAAADRKYPVYFSFAYITNDDVTLMLPSGYQTESLPAPTKLDFSAAIYENGYEKREGAVHFTRRVQIDAPYIPVQYYGAVRNFFSKTATVDQEQIVLRKATPKAASR